MLFRSHSRGLGTCLQGAVNVWDDAIRSEFEIPKDYRLLCGLALGYPSDAKINTFAANRLNPSEIKFKEK